MTQTTPKQIEILQHTLGLSAQSRTSHRNHFVAGEGHSDMPDLLALEASGLMLRQPHLPSFLTEDDFVFFATEKGLEVALANLPPPPKRTRYSDWLDSDGSGCESFGEFLLGGRLPQLESRDRLVNCSTFKRQWRMYRPAVYASAYCEAVTGEWCSTKASAKESYKAALNAKRKEAKHEVPY